MGKQYKLHHKKLYGDINKLDDLQWSKLKVILSISFDLIYISDNTYVMLYQYKHNRNDL